MLNVIKLETGYADKYEDFILKHKDTLFYYSIKYKYIIKELLSAEDNYLVCFDNNDIKGVFPLMKKLGKYGYVYNSLPFYGSNGGVIAENEGAFNALISEYNALISENNVAAATIIANPLSNVNYSTAKHQYSDQRIGQFVRLDLKPDAEYSLMNMIDSSTRRNIRKAIKCGIKINIDNDFEEYLHEAHVENMKIVGGRSKPKLFFELIKKHLISGDDYNIYVAELNGKRIAALLLFYYGGIVEYFVPAVLKEFRTHQPLALIIFKAMLDAHERGYRLWNWGGTWLTQDGVYKFKKKWNSIDKKYLYYVHVGNPDLFRSTPEELLKEHEYFYVLPFNLLGGINANETVGIDLRS